MGQSSIAMLNKVGYSMFWGSMWDNKINYSRLLKEDMYIDKFFDLIFNDNLSANVFNLKNLKKESFKNIKFNILSFSNQSNTSIYKYLKYSNKIKCFNTRIWILKYQNWVILYNFIYLQQFEKVLKKKKFIYNNFNYRSDFSYIINLYSKINKTLKLSYKLYNQNKKKVFF